MMKMEVLDERVEFFRTFQEMPAVDFTVYLCGAGEHMRIGDA
jgi:hypothetical protein